MPPYLFTEIYKVLSSRAQVKSNDERQSSCSLFQTSVRQNALPPAGSSGTRSQCQAELSLPSPYQLLHQILSSFPRLSHRPTTEKQRLRELLFFPIALSEPFPCAVRSSCILGGSYYSFTAECHFL